MSCSMQWAHVGFLFELRFIEHYQSKIIIRMVDQEVLFDDIEQEIIKPPRNSSKKTLKRYTRYPCHWYFVQKLWGCIPTVARAWNCKVVAFVYTSLPTTSNICPNKNSQQC